MRIHRSSGLRTVSGRRGALLVWAMFLTMLVVSSTFVVAAVSRSTEQRATAERRAVTAEFLSLSASARAKSAVLAAIRNNVAPPPNGTVTVAGAEATWTAVQTGAPAIERDPSGLARTETVFRIEGAATVEGTRTVVREVVRGVQVPLFQFAIFYQDEMHFLYPAPMFINGPVHCNSDVYLYAHKGLEFDTNHFSIAGDLIGDMKFPEWAVTYAWGPAKEISIRNWVSDPYNPAETRSFESLEAKFELDALGIPSAGGYDSRFAGYDANLNGSYGDAGDLLPFAPGAVDRYGPPPIMLGTGSGHTLRTQAHGVQAVQVPEIGDFDMYVPQAGGDFVFDAGSGTYVAVAAGSGTHTEGPYFRNAALKIISAPDGTWQALDGAGNDVSAGLAGIVTSTTMYDARQADGNGQSIQVTKLDMAALAASALYPANGLLYYAGQGAGPGTDVKGFQIVNGSELPTSLSVVSPDSIYVRGNYNTVNPKSAAVMADAVNLLSNSWSGTKSPGSLPSASTTTYNMSILAGDTEATATNFNGGPHNLPRFHENWNGVEAHILGSLVCVGHSERATGRFQVYGDYYEAPIRRWTFDTRLTDVNQLPPFTPTFSTIEELVVW